MNQNSTENSFILDIDSESAQYQHSKLYFRKHRFSTFIFKLSFIQTYKLSIFRWVLDRHLVIFRVFFHIPIVDSVPCVRFLKPQKRPRNTDNFDNFDFLLQCLDLKYSLSGGLLKLWKLNVFSLSPIRLLIFWDCQMLINLMNLYILYSK